MQKRLLIELIIGRSQRNCKTEMYHCKLWNCLFFGIESKSLWYDGVTHYQRHSVVQMGSGKGHSYPLCCIIYKLYRYLNHYLLATGVGCYIWGAWANSLSYVDDVVLLVTMVTALHPLLEVCGAFPLPHDIVYHTTKTVCLLSRQNNHGVGTQ